MWLSLVFKKRGNQCHLLLSADKPRWLCGVLHREREMLGTAGKFPELRSSAFALSRPTLGWAGLGWAKLDWVRLCRDLGSMSSTPDPLASLFFPPLSPCPCLFPETVACRVGWWERETRLCLGLECVLLQCKYLGQLSVGSQVTVMRQPLLGSPRL